MTKNLTRNGAIATITFEYIEAFSKLSDKKLQYLLDNPDEIERNVLEYISQYSIDLALGDRVISEKVLNMTEEEIATEMLSKLEGLSSRVVLATNLANSYINTTTKLMYKASKANQLITNQEIEKVEKELAEIDERLKELSEIEC